MSRFTDNDLKRENELLREAGEELARASEQTHDGCPSEAWERQDRALNLWEFATTINKGEQHEAS